MSPQGRRDGAARGDWAVTVSARRVIHEEIDGEILAIDNATGVYLSLRDLGADLWRALADGVTRTDLCAAVAGAYGVGTPVAAEAVERFVGRLDELGVLEAIDVAAAVSPDIAPSGTPGARPAPDVEVYTDLQQLLLFDPIHEVDEEGWPHAST